MAQVLHDVVSAAALETLLAQKTHVSCLKALLRQSAEMLSQMEDDIKSMIFTPFKISIMAVMDFEAQNTFFNVSLIRGPADLVLKHISNIPSGL